MHRRTVIIGFGAALLNAGSALGTDGLTLVMIGAKNCPSCAAWKRSQWPAFASSAEYKKLQFREIDAPTIGQAYDMQFWPDDLHQQHDFLVSQKAFGTPNFFLLRGRRMVRHASGVGGWTNKVWPEIQKQTTEG